MLGAIGLGAHGADIFELIALRDISIVKLIPQQEESTAVHGEQEGVFPILTEFLHSGKTQVTASFLIKAFFVLILARHTDLAMFTGLINILQPRIFPALHDQKVCPAENIDGALREGIRLFCKLVVQ